MNRLILFFLFFMPVFQSASPDKTTILDTRVTMKIYPSEILESVIFRLHCETDKPIDYNTLMLLPYMAKAADYNDVAVRDILEEQLKSTPITYSMKKKKLVIHLKNDGTGR